MSGKVNVSIRGKSDLTKKRLRINALMKKAMKGGKQAKDKLYKEFVIKVYSSEEIGSYVDERLKTEMVDDSPLQARGKRASRRKGDSKLRRR